MNYYGHAEETANKILEAFKSGNLPAALAPVFIFRKDDAPCRKWSWGNQLLCVIHGTSDARGFRQWNEAGRYVKKGSKAFSILVPVLKKVIVKESDGRETERTIPVAFKTAPVFRIEDTDGEPIEADPAARAWIDSLPLIEVARKWKLNVDSYTGNERAPLGQYTRGTSIALGVKNLSTWAHELVHAADDKAGNLVERGQALHSEAVAELGGAILLECLGYKTESDLGGAYDYIQSYALREGKDVITVAMQVLNRTCQAVDLILSTAEGIQNAPLMLCDAPAAAN